MVEHIPHQGRAHAPGQGGGRRGERGGRQAHGAAQRDRGIERRLAHADLRGLGRQQHFGGAHVGAAPQEIGRHVDDERERGLRDHALAGLHFGQRPGRARQQHAQGVLRLAQRALQLGNDGQRAQILRAGLLHVELGFVAALEQALGDLQAALLDRRVLVRDAKAKLGGADAAVQAGGLRRHQHLRIVVLRDAGEVAGVGRFDAAPVLAPEVHLPGDVEAGAGAPEGRVGAARLPLAGARGAGGNLLHLRVQATAGNAQQRSRFEDAHGSNANARVLALRLRHHLFEHRVAEVRPPGIDGGRRLRASLRVGRGQCALRPARPVRQPGHGRPLEVRPEGGAPAQQLASRTGQRDKPTAGQARRASRHASQRPPGGASCGPRCTAGAVPASTQPMKIW